MKVKKQSKLKSAGRIRYFKTFGWLLHVAYRLRGDSTIRHYLKTGKYIKTTGEIYELVTGLEVQELFISSTVKRSRVKNIPDGFICLPRNQENDDPMQALLDLSQELGLYNGGTE